MRRGIARSRAHALELIESGGVRVSGIPAPKPTTLVAPSIPIEVEAEPPPYVSRGGLKLERALQAFRVEVEGRRALDAGASTGGFTDCLLQHGAVSVTAVDVGYGQLAEPLRRDARVQVRDRVNIRQADPGSLGGPFPLIVADLSFISLCTVAPALARLAEPGADLILLVKPQFEVGRGKVGRGGIVRDPELHHGALVDVVSCLDDAGLGTQGIVESPIRGAKGNREFLLHAEAGTPPASSLEYPA